MTNDSPPGALAWFVAFCLAASASGIEFIHERLWNSLKNLIHEDARLMCLSADLHDSKSSEDSSLVFKGVKIISSSIEITLLQTVPILPDLIVAIDYFTRGYRLRHCRYSSSSPLTI
jgi:hypothetical protein